jgi:uncharacterized surface anchored protein
MLSRTLWLTLAIVGALALVSAPASAQATISNEPVYFTFANPVAIPGMTLKPGQYEFRMTSDKGDRNVVKVYERATGNAVATVMAIPAHLPNGQPVPQKAEVRFYETPANQPPAIQSWWYPGIHDGHEFIYARQRAQEIAKINPQGVPTTEGPVESGAITRATSDGQPAKAARQPVTEVARNNSASSRPAMKPMPAPAASPSPAPAPQPQAQASQMNPQPVPARRMLPQTASELPFAAVIGVFSILAGVVLMRRRVA